MLKLGNNSVTRQYLILYIPAIAKHIRGVFLYLQTCWYKTSNQFVPQTISASRLYGHKFLITPEQCKLKLTSIQPK